MVRRKKQETGCCIAICNAVTKCFSSLASTVLQFCFAVFLDVKTAVVSPRKRVGWDSAAACHMRLRLPYPPAKQSWR